MEGMTTRSSALLAAGLALTLYAGALVAAWMVAQSVPRAERDGVEWMYVFLLTMPWSLLAGVGGWLIVHVGAVVNGGLIALVAARGATRRWSAGG